MRLGSELSNCFFFLYTKPVGVYANIYHVVILVSVFSFECRPTSRDSHSIRTGLSNALAESSDLHTSFRAPQALSAPFHILQGLYSAFILFLEAAVGCTCPRRTAIGFSDFHGKAISLILEEDTVLYVFFHCIVAAQRASLKRC